MIVDGRSVEENETVESDVCIVGAGVAGITLAREFIDHGFEVLLLESGDLKFDADTQSLCSGESTGHRYFPLDISRARQFGGSPNFWAIDIGEGHLGGARFRPLDALDFEKRDEVPYSGWPFGKTELDPFYDRAHSFVQAGPPSYDVGDWEDSEKRPRLPFLNGRVQTVIFKFISRERFIHDLRYEVTQADNILTFLYANALEIETDETAQTVKRLRVGCLAGNRFWIKAKIFILAMGGIETPRLLLLSNKVQKSGLGNENDLVGRFFMEHLHFSSGIYLPSDVAGCRQAALYRGIHWVRQVPIVGKLALSEELIRREKLLNQNIQLMPHALSSWETYPGIWSEAVVSFQTLCAGMRQREVPAGCTRHLKNLVGNIEDVAEAARQKFMRGMFRTFNGKEKTQAFLLAHIAEQAPNPDSRVTVSAERDSLGQNRVRLNWRLSEIDFLSPIRTQEIIDIELRRAGLGRLRIELRDPIPPPDLHGGHHHMGTTRMHVDPKKGVVDPNCRVHGVSNLFIAGPSVFPTGGYANPVHTTVALALRLADHIRSIMN
jgi:choline dehydrogenase-like flavoprotein